MNIKTHKMEFLIFLLAGVMPAFAPSVAEATVYQSLKSIQDVAKEFVEDQYVGKYGVENIEIIPARLDPRLRLVQCDQALEASSSSNAGKRGRLTVNIRCNGIKPWVLYVPIQMKIMQDIVVLSNSLSRNSLLSRSDLHLEQRDINKLHSGYFSNLNEVVGKTLKRSLNGGLALSPTYVESSMLIKRGQQVTLMARAGGIIVKMMGKAMSNGVAGERIKVKNLNSNRVIEGTITENGIVITQM